MACSRGRAALERRPLPCRGSSRYLAAPRRPHGGGQEVDGSGCYYTGLKDLTKQVSDSPPSVPGVVALSSEWGLKGVTPSQAVSSPTPSAPDIRQVRP